MSAVSHFDSVNQDPLKGTSPDCIDDNSEVGGALSVISRASQFLEKPAHDASNTARVSFASVRSEPNGAPILQAQTMSLGAACTD